jgi:hypothetical protein
MLVITLITGTVPAQQTAQQNNSTNVSDVAPYYEEGTATPDTDRWTDGHREPALTTLLEYLARAPGFILGNGGAAQGGGLASGLLLSVVLLGGVVSVGATSNVGSVGGAVLGVVGVVGLATAGFVPAWMRVVVLFGLGAVLAAVVIRIWR